MVYSNAFWTELGFFQDWNGTVSAPPNARCGRWNSCARNWPGPADKVSRARYFAPSSHLATVGALYELCDICHDVWRVSQSAVYLLSVLIEADEQVRSRAHPRRLRSNPGCGRSSRV